MLGCCCGKKVWGLEWHKWARGLQGAWHCQWLIISARPLVTSPWLVLNLPGGKETYILQGATRGCLLIIFHFENFSMILQIWSIVHLGSFDLGLVRLLINLCFLKSLCIAIRFMSVLNGWPCTDICRTWLLISQLMVNLLRYMHASGRYGQKEFKIGILPGSQ